MAYIIDSIKKFRPFKKKQGKHRTLNNENTIFIAILLLSIFVIIIDYNLIIKFINVLKSI